MLVKSGVFGRSPGCRYELHTEQIGASGHNRTVRITVKFKVDGSSSQSKYGYPINWKGRIHGSYSGWMHVKGNDTWYGGQGFRSYSWTQTVNVGTTGAANITVGFQTDMTTGSSSWETTQTASYQTGQTNTPPYFNDGNKYVHIKYGGINESQVPNIIPENTGRLFVNWGQGSDNEGGQLKYSLDIKVNNGGWNNVYVGNNNYTHVNISIGEGQSVEFRADVCDSSGVWGGQHIYSKRVTKNTFSPDIIRSGDSINFDTSVINFTYSGANNTNGNGDFSQNLTCDGLPVYNSTVSGSGTSLTIWKGGATPSTPYVKFDELKEKLSAGNLFEGVLVFRLFTRNAYGSEKSDHVNINVNIKKSPSTAGNFHISKDGSLSTAYKYVEFSKNSYFIPDEGRVIYIGWNPVSCPLGTNIRYDLYLQFGDEQWQLVGSGLTGTNFRHNLQKQTSSKRFRYIIRAITSYNWGTDTYTGYETAHFYNKPTLSVGNITRGADGAEVRVTIRSVSSIPNISTIGDWKCNFKDTQNQVSSGGLNVSQNEQVIRVTNLGDSFQYDLWVAFADNTGFEGVNGSSKIAIGANSPVFFVNKYGIGVNGYKATADANLNVKGSVNIDGNLNPSRVVLDDNWGDRPDDAYGDTNIIVGTNDHGQMPGSYYSLRNFQMGDNNKFGFQLASFFGGENILWFRSKFDQTEKFKAWRRIPFFDESVNFHNIACHDLNTRGSISTNNIQANTWNGVALMQNTGAPGTVINKIPFVRSDGTIEIGQYLDFHSNGTSGNDFTARLSCWSDGKIETTGAFECNGDLSIGANGDLNVRRIVMPERDTDFNNVDYDSYAVAGNTLPNRPLDWTAVRSFGCSNEHKFQLSWYYGQSNGLFYRSKHDSSPNWNGWDRIALSNVFTRIDDGGSFLRLEGNKISKAVDIWASDEKLKENVVNLKNRKNISALGVIEKIEHFAYNYKDISLGESVACGYISQQLEGVDESFVDSVEQIDDALNKNGEILKFPKASKIIPYLSKAIQELSEQNKMLTIELEEIKKKIGVTS